ncbi:MAG: hypothetical protein DSM106950_31715 [Stigonema ocellatum SAG 48.90 = DSM 106950]|nr:hypothetical protein [Stigonema ocellatum SAG 48.90 = DSM 106950]
MNKLKVQQKWDWISVFWVGIEILAVLALLSVRLLLKANMAWNEMDVLPLARQYVDPNWIPQDWYLNQPPSYRVLFQSLVGPLIVTWGFVRASIVGRLVCYSLVASGLVLIARKLGLNLLLLLLAVSLFLSPNEYRSVIAQVGLLPGNSIKWVADALAVLAIGLIFASKKLRLGLPLSLVVLAVSLFLRADNGQWLSTGLVAGEWLIGGLESKAVAYGLVLLAIGLMLRRRYRWMSFLLGLATSFHVLVGGYAFFSVLGWFVLKPKTRLPNRRVLALLVLLYLTGSVFAIKPLLQQLFAHTSFGSLLPSYIYVFLALPFHLNPLSWGSGWWMNLVAYLSILLLSASVIRLMQSLREVSQEYTARMELFQFTLITLIPFVLGLAIAPFDSQGSFLQYYPFRFADVILPLNSCLLFSCALQDTFCGMRVRWVLLLICILLLNWIERPQIAIIQSEIQALRSFPNENSWVYPQWKEMASWIQKNTPKDAIIASPPMELQDITWLTQRRIIATWKQLAQTKTGIVEWYERLRDLSGDFRGVNHLRDFGKQLSDGYKRLTTTQARELMVKYQANYFLTRVEHRLDLPVAYRNQEFVLYKKSP